MIRRRTPASMFWPNDDYLGFNPLIESCIRYVSRETAGKEHYSLLRVFFHVVCSRHRRTPRDRCVAGDRSFCYIVLLLLFRWLPIIMFLPRLSYATRLAAPRFTSRAVSTKTVADALKFSGYSEIDFTIPENSMVYEAVQKFAAFNIGCLVTVDAAGTYRH